MADKSLGLAMLLYVKNFQFIDVPEVKTRKWVPPYKRRRRHRPKLQKIPAEEITKPLYDFAKLKRVSTFLLYMEEVFKFLQEFHNG